MIARDRARAASAQAIRDARISGYWYLCRRGARKFLRPGIDRSDLEQVAAVGLVKAAGRFDPTNGAPFEAYAWMLIVGELMHYVRDHERLIRLPRSLRALERRYVKIYDELSALTGREPARAELSAALHVSAAALDELLRARYAAEVVPPAVPVLDRAPAQAAGMGFEDRVALQDTLSVLDSTERAVIDGLYNRGLSRVEIGRKLCFSERHISRLHQRALRKIHEAWT